MKKINKNQCFVLKLDDYSNGVTVSLSHRVLVFLLHQEEASVRGRAKFPHRTRRRWVPFIDPK